MELNYGRELERLARSLNQTKHLKSTKPNIRQAGVKHKEQREGGGEVGQVRVHSSCALEQVLRRLVEVAGEEGRGRLRLAEVLGEGAAPMCGEVADTVAGVYRKVRGDTTKAENYEKGEEKKN